MILVKTFYAHNDLRNYSYLILDKENGNSWVIDPFDAKPIIDYIKKNGITLRGILNTHSHWDHVKGNDELSDVFSAPIRKLKSSETIELDTTHTLETLDTPGHTLDHQVFIWNEKKKPLALFSGDTLFNSGVGNCKNGGDVNLLYATTELLKKLPGDVLLYPGHDYRKRNLEFALSVEPENKMAKESLKEVSGLDTTNMSAVSLGEEKLVNPFFRLQSEEIQHGLKENSEKELFIKLRSLRDKW